MLPDAEAPITPELANLIRTARLEREMSQKELGRRIGRPSWGYISRMERGVVPVPYTVVLIRLAIALNLDFTDMIIKGKVVEGLVNRKQINNAIEFVRIFETDLDIKESARICRAYLVSAIARSSEISSDVRNVLRVALKNFDYIYSICFDLTRKQVEVYVPEPVPIEQQSPNRRRGRPRKPEKEPPKRGNKIIEI
jgi:transcriptional regulator with XRE-family HTH domain